ncbi:AmmeMemoRadiSam system protein B [Bifidobacterium bifidum]|uniref:AmmeMemoRadiSam system protein B n=1 Tax=Bifidobacterium bifidum TaxID=1681 RepID=UPI001C239C92|nr:AmmeMemoRadiSam system protein B [Bifidobacterium bifidum]MBU8983063.1 AmmeMemoRadiSam system protein B [Bifidobacterium bifidum]MBU8986609.1 AmmeMemoRadiSam system protein B [Bifidobacterium bifidum]
MRGIACCTAGAFDTPLGRVPVDVEAERQALHDVPAMIVNDPTHEREHAVEVQIPFMQTVLGSGCPSCR